MNKFLSLSLLFAACGLANAQTIVAWGDSLTAGTGGTSWTSQFSSDTGLTTINRGVGGNTSTQIKDRFLAEPGLHDDFSVIWAGRNNYSTPTTVLADIATMVAELAHTDYLILGVINGDYGGYESVGGVGYNYITGINDSLSSTYGNRFLDIRGVLIASSLDPEADESDLLRDIVPLSLRSDSIHLNTAGYGIVADSVYQAYLAIPEPADASVWLAAGAALCGLGRRRGKVSRRTQVVYSKPSNL